MITSNHKKLSEHGQPRSKLSQQANLLLDQTTQDQQDNDLSVIICAISSLASLIQDHLLSPSSFETRTDLYPQDLQRINRKPNHKLFPIGPDLSTIIAIGLGLLNRSSSLVVDHSGFFGHDWVALDLDITRTTIDLFSTYAQSIISDHLQDDQSTKNYLFFIAKFSSIASLSPSIVSKQDNTRPKPRWIVFVLLTLSDKSDDHPSHHLTDPTLQAPTSRPTDDYNARLEDTSSASLDKPSLLKEINRYRTVLDPLSNPELCPSTELDIINYSIKLIQFLLQIQLSNLNQFEITVHEILNQVEATIIILPSQNSKQSKLKTATNNQKEFLSKMIILTGMLNQMIIDPLIQSIHLLNTLNILHQLIRLIQSSIDLDSTSHPDSITLRTLLVDVIGNLSSRIFYDDQINDMNRDIWGRIKTLNRALLFLPKDSTTPTEQESSILISILFDCLNRIIITSNNSKSTDLKSKLNHHQHQVSLSIWKENLSILDELNHSKSRSNFFKAFRSFLKFEAFPIGRPHRDEDRLLKVELLSTINVLAYRKSINRAVSDSEIGDEHQGQEEEERPGLSDCLLEILGFQEFIILEICVPMLRELDQKKPHQIGGPSDLVLESLKKISQVWKLEDLVSSCIKVEAGNNRIIEWDSIVKLICNSGIVHLSSGLDYSSLEKLFVPHHWSVSEGRNLAGWTGNPVSRRSTIVNGTTSQLPKIIQRMSSAVGMRADHQSRTNIAVKPNGINPETRRVYLSNLHNYHRSSSLSLRSSSVINNPSFLTVKQDTSVSDLRNTLIGNGFINHHHSSDRNGRNSVLVLNNSRSSHNFELSNNNHSTGDLSGFMYTTNNNSTTNTTVHHHANLSSTNFFNTLPNSFRGSSSTTTNNRNIMPSLTHNLFLASDDSSDTNHQSIPHTLTHLDNENEDQYKTSLVRRQTLTAEVLDKLKLKTSNRPVSTFVGNTPLNLLSPTHKLFANVHGVGEEGKDTDGLEGIQEQEKDPSSSSHTGDLTSSVTPKLSPSVFGIPPSNSASLNSRIHSDIISTGTTTGNTNTAQSSLRKPHPSLRKSVFLSLSVSLFLSLFWNSASFSKLCFFFDLLILDFASLLFGRSVIIQPPYNLHD
ncbi:hypothetical protein PSTT_03179 [Puccinia striiformis]|uniref:Uncharacterized protein n=1 Tax=Puccinia striiformis TaxID=27350 RepID=A0A2S4VXF1_9BASI|nr:hypothetical protein PSTT_03179 [Puccinia striiformis]